MRIREVVLPAADPAVPAAFHPERYGASVVRFEPGPEVCSHFAVNVPPERFEEAVAWGREQAPLIQDDVPFPLWRARAAYYFDPAGNLVELIARERAPGEELLIEVSEVGLPVADVGAAVDFLEAELGLPHFSGDRENFSAVGDDRGLFILVPVGRAWLFTDRPAADARVRVTIEGSAERELSVPGSSHVIEIASV
jgi:catechol 2,3-dioxygenase-like lactoylglutathione lyase family enzyme